LTVGTKFEDLNFDVLENWQTTANERVKKCYILLGQLAADRGEVETWWEVLVDSKFKCIKRE
jgi:hypothetical protein